MSLHSSYWESNEATMLFWDRVLYVIARALQLLSTMTFAYVFWLMVVGVWLVIVRLVRAIVS